MLPGSAQPPATRPRGLGPVLLLVPVATASGVATGLAPHTAMVVLGAVASLVVLVLRVDWAALAVISTAVFQSYLDLVSPWTTEWLAAVLVAAWLVRRARGPLHAHRLRGLALASGLFALAVLLAFAVHPHGLPGLTVCLRYLALLAVLLVLADCLCGPLAPRRAARAYVLACVLASVCGLVAAVGSDGHRVAGPVGSADALAFFLVAAAPLVGAVRARRGQPLWWAWACLAVLLAAGVGTRSPSALVALVGMVAVALATGLLVARHAGVVLALLVSATALVAAVQPVSLGESLSDAGHSVVRTLHHGDDVRRAALQMTSASPVVGLGPAALPLLLQDHLPAGAPVSRPVRSASSTPLEVSAELGLLGLAALYTVWILPAVGAVRRWRRARTRFTAATLLALGGLLVASLVASQQYALPLWFLAAMTYAQGRPAHLRAPIFPSPGRERTSGQLAPT